MGRTGQQTGNRPGQEGLTLEKVMAILTELRKLSNDQTITKFNASRRLKNQPDNDEKAVFTVEVAMRSPPANRIQGLLDQMTDNAAWGLVAAQLRPPSLRRRWRPTRRPHPTWYTDLHHPLAGTAAGRHQCPRSVAARPGSRDLGPG